MTKGFISALNAVGDNSHYLYEKVVGPFSWNLVKNIFPTGLGAMGGWLTGAMYKGGLQGAISGGLAFHVINPLTRWVKEHEGEGPDQIHKKSVKFLSVVGFVAKIAIPILITYKLGDQIFHQASAFTPSFLGWMIPENVSNENYTIFRGLLSIAAPVVCQEVIGFLRESDKEVKKI